MLYIFTGVPPFMSVAASGSPIFFFDERSRLCLVIYVVTPWGFSVGERGFFG